MALNSTDSVEVANSQLDWSALESASVLVTGAGGFLGSALVEALLARNDITKRTQPHSVIALVRDVKRAKARFSPHPSLQFVEQDLSHPLGELPPFDYVVHAASQASPKFYGSDPIGTMLPNIAGTHQLLEKAVVVKAKGFLFVSSGEVYGEVSPTQVPTREHEYGYLDPTNVRSCYGESKRCGETLCVSYWKQKGLRTVIARPFHTYGPGISLDDGRVFADFVRDVVERKNIVLKSDGLAQRAFCYVSDAITGILSVLLSGQAGEAYNVGNPAGEISVRDLAELLIGLFPDRGLRVEFAERADGPYLASPLTRNSPNIEKLQALGWSPNVDLREGFTRTIDAIETRMRTETASKGATTCS
jgi:nucleoside-diphosphate-sugar epimerase